MTGAATRPPILCLVTDRRRAGGDGERHAAAQLVEQARHAAEAGVNLIQVRERDLEAAQLVELVSRILDAVRGSRTEVVVNERLDVAIAAGAAGVHLRGDSVPAARARILLDRVASLRGLASAPRLVGRSVHSVGDAREQAGADYLVAGTMYPTASKPGSDRILGVDGLRAIVAASPAPVLAIGGITIDRIGEVASTGAAGVAAIGLFLGEDGTRSRVIRLVDRVTELHRRFAESR